MMTDAAEKFGSRNASSELSAVNERRVCHRALSAKWRELLLCRELYKGGLQKGVSHGDVTGQPMGGTWPQKNPCRTAGA